MTDFCHIKHAENSPPVAARLIALDGLPFSLFVTSMQLRKSFQARGFDVPKSKETIKCKFMEFYITAKENMKAEIGKNISQGDKISISFDE